MSLNTHNVSASRVLYGRLLGYAAQYKRYFVISVFGFTVLAAMEALMAHLMKYFIDGLETRDSTLIIYVPLAIIVVRLVHGVGSYLGNFYIARVGLGVVNDLRKQLFDHMMYLPTRFYDQHNSGELVSLIVYNIQQVTGAVTNAVKIVLRDGLTVVALLAYLFYQNWLLTCIFLLLAPVLAGLVTVASRYFRKISRSMQFTMGGISHIANEAIQGFRLVRSYGGEKYESKRFAETSDDNTRLGTKYERISAAQAPVFHQVIAVDLAVLLFLILFFWNTDTGSAVAYVTAAAMIAKPIRQLSSVNEIIQKGLAAAESIFSVLDVAPAEDRGTKLLDRPKGRIEIRDVTFGYSDEMPALKNVSLDIEPGQTVALVGRSGSGKSTLASLLLRFYDPQGGEIRIDGASITEVKLSSLRQQIALVNQQTVLFNDTVLKNIAYAVDEDKIDRAEVERAAENAYARSFIEKLPQGFDTLVGEDGARLSGGQRQRLAVARALFKDAPILILDEATSALDTESEQQIQQALERLQKGRTTLVIAHRLSTIEKADKIVVMDQGQIVEQGTHAELLEKNGYYASLHAVQFEA
jgi:subfamily B ATP-binding cassette protein MsbA